MQPTSVPTDTHTHTQPTKFKQTRTLQINFTKVVKDFDNYPTLTKKKKSKIQRNERTFHVSEFQDSITLRCIHYRNKLQIQYNSY